MITVGTIHIPPECEQIVRDLAIDEAQIGTISLPKVEIDAQKNYWLVDEDDERVRTVCASQLPGRPIGDVCLRDAGNGTSHRGYGRCVRHGGGEQVRRSVYMGLTTLSGGGKRFEKKLKEVEAIGEEVYRFDNEIQLLTGVLATMVEEQMNKPDVIDADGNVVSKLDMKFTTKMNGMVGNLVRAKMARAREENKLVISMDELAAFVDKIFMIIEKICPSNMSKKIEDQIRKELIVPFEEQAEAS